MATFVNFLICFLLLSSAPTLGNSEKDPVSATTAAFDVRGANDEVTVIPSAEARVGDSDHDDDASTATPAVAGVRVGNDVATTSSAESYENRNANDPESITAIPSESREGGDYESTATMAPESREGGDRETTTVNSPESREGNDNEANTATSSTTVSMNDDHHGPIQQRSHVRFPFESCPESMNAGCGDDHECQIVIDIRTGDEKEYHCIKKDCGKKRCSNNGHCVGSSGCFCDEGFSGNNCSVADVRKGEEGPDEKKESDPSECMNKCPSEQRCVIKNDEVTCLSYACKPNPCKNGGACKESANKGEFKCECTKDYVGDQCENKPGRPVVGVRSGSAWDQKNKGISTVFDRCSVAPSPCSTGERCEMVNSRVVCSALYCTPDTCSGRGTCVEDRSSYRCVCQNGYKGLHCENSLEKFTGPCNPNPCKGDCTCRESCQHEYGYYCASEGGYMGKNCTIQVPRIRCGQRSISVDIPEALYAEFDKGMRNTIFYLAQSSNPGSRQCEAVNVGGVFHYDVPLPFISCGTSRRRMSDALVVKNRVFMDRRSTLFSMPVPILDFECRYEREYRLVTSIKPLVTQPELITKYGQFAPEVELCKVSSCQSDCPEKFQVNMGAVYTVGEKIQLSATALPQNGFMDYVTTIADMRLSCTASSGNSAGLSLIADGCPANSGLSTTYEIGHRACVSFQTPRALGCETAYIHLHLQLCSPSELQTCAGGMQKCVPIAGRKRRSLAEINKNGYVFVGPLVIINGSEGAEKMILYPEASAKAPVYVNEIEVDEIPSVERRSNVTRPEAVDGNNVTIVAILVPVALVIVFYILLMYSWQKSTSRLRSSFTVKRPLIRNSRFNLGSNSSDDSILCEVSQDCCNLEPNSTVLTSVDLCKCGLPNCDCRAY
ncbi:uncharacterized protein LOC120337438 [Styela clava]